MSCPGAGPNQPPEWVAYSAAVSKFFNTRRAFLFEAKRSKDQAQPWWRRIIRESDR